MGARFFAPSSTKERLYLRLERDFQQTPYPRYNIPKEMRGSNKRENDEIATAEGAAEEGKELR